MKFASVHSSDSLDVEVTYYENGSKRERKINLKKPVFMYNGKAVTFADRAEAEAFFDEYMQNGQLVFLDNTDKAGENVLFIENYSAHVVSMVDIPNECIDYDIYYSGSGIGRGTLDLSKIENVFYYDENGQETDIGNFANGDVIMVYTSLDNQLCKVYRSVKTVTGTVQRRSKLDEITANSTAKTYETIAEINFDDAAVTSQKAYVLDAKGTLADGRAYTMTVDGGTTIGAKTGFVKFDSLNDSSYGGVKKLELPEISSGNLFLMDKNFNGGFPRAVGVYVRNVIDKNRVKVGDVLKATAYIYTDDVCDDDNGSVLPLDDQENATSLVRFWLRQENTATFAGYNRNQFFDKPEGILEKELPNRQWQEVSFEYEVTTQNTIATDLKFDTLDAVIRDLPYARSILFAGIKVERLTGGLRNMRRKVSVYSMKQVLSTERAKTDLSLREPQPVQKLQKLCMRRLNKWRG